MVVVVMNGRCSFYSVLMAKTIVNYLNVSSVTKQSRNVTNHFNIYRSDCNNAFSPGRYLASPLLHCQVREAQLDPIGRPGKIS